MTLAAALMIGVFCALFAGFVVGRPVTFRSWPRAGHRPRSAELWLAQAGARVTARQFFV